MASSRSARWLGGKEKVKRYRRAAECRKKKKTMRKSISCGLIVLLSLCGLYGCKSRPAAEAESPVSLERAEPGEVLQSAMEKYVQAAGEQKLNIQSVMVLQHGKVLFEKWWNGGEPDVPHVLNSVSKTFTATAVGLAVGEGLLSLDDILRRMLFQVQDENAVDAGGRNTFRVVSDSS